jgi:hypothetical protein
LTSQPKRRINILFLGLSGKLNSNGEPLRQTARCFAVQTYRNVGWGGLYRTVSPASSPSTPNESNGDSRDV